MYVDKGALTVYSLNLDIYSINNDQIDSKNDYWGIGLSNVMKGKNEYSIHYQKKGESESIETLYNYYIKPDFYLKMRYGISSKYIKNYIDIPNEIEHSMKLSIYGSNNNNDNNNALKFYPILSYEYFVNEDKTYDVFKIGLSILFNDIKFY